MPARPPKICRAQGCSAATRNKNGFCDQHQHLHVNHGWSRRQKGTTTTKRGYGASWRKIRKIALDRDQFCCVLCRAAGKIAPAHAVDHIVPKTSGGTDALSNLQSLCRSCHKAKTQQEAAQATSSSQKEG